MIYILIFVVTLNGKPAAVTQEFHNRQACQAAALEVGKQAPNQRGYDKNVIFCAAKGEKK